MAHGDPHDKDGNVSLYPADAQRLQSYTQAELQPSQFQAPIFIHASNPHERLYVACLDGTGNDETEPQFGLKTTSPDSVNSRKTTLIRLALSTNADRRSVGVTIP